MVANEQTISELAQQLGACLKKKGMHLVAAESCTGGWIAKAITDLAGSSDWFDGSLVCYSNDLKNRLLDVPEEILEIFGAVSSETVQAMAEGVFTNTAADIVVSVSGIAGPGGGSDDKPVGTVWLSWGLRGEGIHTRLYVFEGDRKRVRLQTVKQALDLLLEVAGCG